VGEVRTVLNHAPEVGTLAGSPSCAAVRGRREEVTRAVTLLRNFRCRSSRRSFSVRRPGEQGLAVRNLPHSSFAKSAGFFGLVTCETRGRLQPPSNLDHRWSPGADFRDGAAMGRARLHRVPPLPGASGGPGAHPRRAIGT